MRLTKTIRDSINGAVNTKITKDFEDRYAKEVEQLVATVNKGLTDIAFQYFKDRGIDQEALLSYVNTSISYNNFPHLALFSTSNNKAVNMPDEIEINKTKYTLHNVLIFHSMYCIIKSWVNFSKVNSLDTYLSEMHSYNTPPLVTDSSEVVDAFIRLQELAALTTNARKALSYTLETAKTKAQLPVELQEYVVEPNKLPAVRQELPEALKAYIP